MERTHAQILPKGTSKPTIPYSPAIRVSDGYVFASGHIGVGKDGKLVEGGVAEQTRATLANLQATLETAGSGLHRIVKVTAFLTDMVTYADFNKAYGECLAQAEPKPARSTVCVVELPLGAKVEIEAVAYCGNL